MDPLKAVEMVDENTICVAAILGSTLTGEFEDVKMLNDLLTEKSKETGGTKTLWRTAWRTKALKQGIEQTGKFDVLSKDIGVPLSLALKDSSKHSVFEISRSMRIFGWYPMPANAEHIAVLRVIIREDFSRSLAEWLVSDLNKVLIEIEGLPSRIAAIATVTARKNDNGIVVKKKSVMEIEREVAAYWRRLVERKEDLQGFASISFF